eukprot:1138600-Pelagomonas_calceolata.AAC.5
MPSQTPSCCRQAGSTPCTWVWEDDPWRPPPGADAEVVDEGAACPGAAAAAAAAAAAVKPAAAWGSKYRSGAAWGVALGAAASKLLTHAHRVACRAAASVKR